MASNAFLLSDNLKIASIIYEQKDCCKQYVKLFKLKIKTLYFSFSFFNFMRPGKKKQERELNGLCFVLISCFKWPMFEFQSSLDTGLKSDPT